MDVLLNARVHAFMLVCVCKLRACARAQLGHAPHALVQCLGCAQEGLRSHALVQCIFREVLVLAVMAMRRVRIVFEHRDLQWHDDLCSTVIQRNRRPGVQKKRKSMQCAGGHEMLLCERKEMKINGVYIICQNDAD